MANCAKAESVRRSRNKDVGKTPWDSELSNKAHGPTQRTVPGGKFSETKEVDNGPSAQMAVVAVTSSGSMSASVFGQLS